MFALKLASLCAPIAAHAPKAAVAAALHSAAAGGLSQSPTCQCCGLPAWLAHPGGQSHRRLNAFISRQHQQVLREQELLSQGHGLGEPLAQQKRSLITPIGGSSPLVDDDEDFDSKGSKDCTVNVLLKNNRQWIKENVDKDPEFLKKLSAPQKPRYLYIGCSDSRVPANEIIGLGPGEVFVHRNVGNQIPGNDLNVLSVLEYAIGTLDIKDILVVGHYDCGAVRAAERRQDLGTLENWLRLIRDVHRLHKETLSHISNEETRHKALVELNVVEQCLNLYKIGVIQRKRIQSEQALIAQGKDPRKHRDEIVPRIHGMVFNFHDGSLKRIPVDFEHRVGSLDHIYGLY